ncbi:hypothetical protein HanPSC8_Chr05g0212971 [Helianthus annuus]|nr:hypothetical protein HanPSC8_Chr05g0212971 [Helianthus annuus]
MVQVHIPARFLDSVEYQEYKSAYISTQKWAYFDAHKGEDWLKDKYHPTNLLVVIESRGLKFRAFR